MHSKQLQEILFIEYKKNGYLDMWNYPISNDNLRSQRIFDIAELGLIVTEISEAQEIIRNTKDTNWANRRLKNECADIIIRTLNFMSRKGFNDAEKIILHKNKQNFRRDYLHGKRV